MAWLAQRASLAEPILVLVTTDQCVNEPLLSTFRIY